MDSLDITETFGKYIEKWSGGSPERARRLLTFGWSAQNLKFRYQPDKRLYPADQYLAQLMMDTMLAPLKDPDNSVMVSVFTPCELLQEAGLHPYNVEAFSCYISASRAERLFLQNAEDSGISETLCSYHKTFIGAAQTGLLPKPRCIVYTNLACDANLLTFRHLAEFYQVPSFVIDVPTKQNRENVIYVADQLRHMKSFVEKHTGKRISEDALCERVARGRRTLDLLDRYQSARADKYVPSDLVTPLYGGMTSLVLLGTKEEERYAQMLLKDLESAPPAKGTRIYWMHTIPFWSRAVRDALCLKENVQIVGCEFAQTIDVTQHADDPYEDMAMRLVYHALSGDNSRRIEMGLKHARQAGADGVVWFNHWGCKHTLGGSRLAKKRFEENGLPLLILDGDGCDRSHGGEGQTATRLEAFLEMLEEKADE